MLHFRHLSHSGPPRWEQLNCLWTWGCTLSQTLWIFDTGRFHSERTGKMFLMLRIWKLVTNWKKYYYWSIIKKVKKYHTHFNTLYFVYLITAESYCLGGANNNLLVKKFENQYIELLQNLLKHKKLRLCVVLNLLNIKYFY